MRDWLICWAITCAFWLNGFTQSQAVPCLEGKAKLQAYWVYFQDKDGKGFNPYTYFEPHAIDRRLRLGLTPFDSLDLPVNQNYLNGLGKLVDSIDVVSRWLNAAYVYADPRDIMAIEQLSFVKSIATAGFRMVVTAAGNADPETHSQTEEQFNLISFHTSHMQGKEFQSRGIDGSGVRIAVFDAGFPDVNTHPVFMNIRDEGRIIASWDFFRNKVDVYHGNHHGTIVLSLIGGDLDGLSIGMAPCAEFLLARTESWYENQVEEKNWLAAAEWADKWGADIINSSLGYTYHRYFPEEMDGQTSVVSRAAAIAFQKGILLVNAAGNSGNSRQWTVVASPADAPSVMAVGALEYPSMLHASYSSPGPTADGRIKPDLSALGTVCNVIKSMPSQIKGTSFACPLVAGFAACVMQLHPEWTNTQVFSAMLQSGSLYPKANNSVGYGVPQASYFFEEKPDLLLPFDFVQPTERGRDPEIKNKAIEDALQARFGMNRLHFHHFFASFSTPAGRPENSSDKLNYAASHFIGLGYRYKRRISQQLSITSDWNLGRIAYYPRQWEKLNDRKITNWNKRKMVILQTGTALYTRINFDKIRGNYIGRYLDLGGYFTWHFNVRWVYFSRGADKEKIRTRFSNPNDMNPFELGLILRIGFQNIALITSYRISDYFRPGSGTGDLPVFLIGIELSAIPF